MAESLPGQRFRLLQETARQGQAERAADPGRPDGLQFSPGHVRHGFLAGGWAGHSPWQITRQLTQPRGVFLGALADIQARIAPARTRTCWTGSAPDDSNVHAALGEARSPGRSAMLRHGTPQALRLWLQKRDPSRRTMAEDAWILSLKCRVSSAAVADLEVPQI